MYRCPCCRKLCEEGWAHSQCIYPALPGMKIIWKEPVIADPDEEC